MTSDYIYSSVFYNPVKNLVAEITVLKCDDGYRISTWLGENVGFFVHYETYSFSKSLEHSREQLKKHLIKLKEDGFIEL